MRTASNPVIVIGASHAAVQLGVSLRQEGYRGDIVLIGQEKHPALQQTSSIKDPSYPAS